MAARANNVFLSETPQPIYDHPMNISVKFGSNLLCGFRNKNENVKFP
jgi:hypothetical protein